MYHFWGTHKGIEENPNNWLWIPACINEMEDIDILYTTGHNCKRFSTDFYYISLILICWKWWNSSNSIRVDHWNYIPESFLISETYLSMDTSSGSHTLVEHLMFIQSFGNFNNSIGIKHGSITCFKQAHI